MTDRRFFTATQLKFVALFTMLLDHLYATMLHDQLWMTYWGSIAFPLFAFEIVQGYMHTHDLRRYARRLLVLAVISEIPFDMVAGGTFFYIWHQNVAWTLLAGLGTCYCADHLTEKDVTASKRALYALGLAAAVALPYLLMTDYDRDGVLLILLFWFTRKGGAVNGLIQVAAMIVMWQFLFTGRAIMIGTFEFQTQCFALCALPLIWLYNGQKGSRSKALQYTAYAFYPAHLFILGIIFMIRVSTMAS